MSKNFFCLVIIFMLCALTGCIVGSAATPLQHAKGDWALSFDETIAANQEMRDLVGEDPEMEQYMRESMQGLTLTVDTERKVVILTVEGQVDDESEFTVVSETPESNKIVLDMNGSHFTLIVKGDRMDWIENGDTLVFERIK